MPQAGATLRRAVHNYSGFVGSTTQVITDHPHVVMTYDDGPDPRDTPRILEALDQAGSTATFFVLAGRAQRSPSLLNEISAAGHEIGLHGLDHRRPTTFGAIETLRRLRDGKAIVEDLTGHAVRWYRPPYGAQNARTWSATKAAGLHAVMWGATTWDWRDVDQQTRVDKVLSCTRKGAIVLCHDGFAGAADGAMDGPAPVLDKYDLANKVLHEFSLRGLQARSLSDALVDGRPFLRAWFSH